MSTIGNKGTRNRVVEYTFVASSDGQTSFSGADVFGVILTFRNGPGLNRISVNGQKISRQSYALNGSTAFTLASGVPKGTIVEFEALYPFNAVDGYITAAADAAFGKRRNFCIDPGFRVSQENGSNAVSIGSGTAYGSDSLFAQRVGSTGAATIQRTVLNTLTPGGSAFFNRITCTTTNPSPAAGDYLVAITRIEGYDAQPLKFGTSSPRNLVYRMAVRSSIQGVFPVAFRNNAANRCYVGSITINPADVGNFVIKTVFLTADTSGTWQQDNTIGVDILIALQCGTSYQGPGNAWAAGGYFGLTNGANFMATANATFDIADIGLYDVTGLTNGVVPPFELDDYQKDLAKCQRYYTKTYPGSVFPLTTGTYAGSFGFMPNAAYAITTWSFPVEMRVTPSVTFYSPYKGTAGYCSSSGDNGDYSAGIVTNGPKLLTVNQSGGNLGSGVNLFFQAVVNARM